MNVRKAVIPVAGFGTRFLPATKTTPKVMFPILDRPSIHHSIEEAIQAGINDVVLVMSHGQESVSEYFDRSFQLEAALSQRGDEHVLREMRAISEMVRISCVYQDKPLGLGHAILTAKEAIGNEPFAVFLPDDLILNDTPTIGDMIGIYGEFHRSVIAVRKVPDEAISGLGIVDFLRIKHDLSQVVGLVEKPNLTEAPSNLAIIGRYILTPEIFTSLKTVLPGALGEIQLTDAINILLSSQEAYAYHFPGVHFDVGTPIGLLKASVYAALNREGLSDEFRRWISTTIHDLG